jgi:hypothetical protein
MTRHRIAILEFFAAAVILSLAAAVLLMVFVYRP